MENNLENAMSFFFKMKKEGNYTPPDIMVAYASLVRPEIKVPSEEWIERTILGAFGTTPMSLHTTKVILSEIKRLNPTATFITE